MWWKSARSLNSCAVLKMVILVLILLRDLRMVNNL